MKNAGAIIIQNGTNHVKAMVMDDVRALVTSFNFDPSRGVGLSTFAVSMIRNEVIDELKHLRRPLAPPGLLVEEALREAEHWIATESAHCRRADFEMIERCVKQFVATLPPRQAAVVAALFNDESFASSSRTGAARQPP